MKIVYLTLSPFTLEVNGVIYRKVTKVSTVSDSHTVKYEFRGEDYLQLIGKVYSEGKGIVKFVFPENSSRESLRKVSNFMCR